jgi:hypothetical protein
MRKFLLLSAVLLTVTAANCVIPAVSALSRRNSSRSVFSCAVITVAVSPVPSFFLPLKRFLQTDLLLYALRVCAAKNQARINSLRMECLNIQKSVERKTNPCPVFGETIMLCIARTCRQSMVIVTEIAQVFGLWRPTWYHLSARRRSIRGRKSEALISFVNLVLHTVPMRIRIKATYVYTYVFGVTNSGIENNNLRQHRLQCVASIPTSVRG